MVELDLHRIRIFNSYVQRMWVSLKYAEINWTRIEVLQKAANINKANAIFNIAR